MKIPSKIKFTNHSIRILRENLLSIAPAEGCALLLGNHQGNLNTRKENEWQVQIIWPCCNSWEFCNFNHFIKTESVNFSNNQKQSKENNFFIDPREQILAQKWAREKDLVVLGSAHSHPSGEAVPSETDIIRSSGESLMVITDSLGNLQAWWIKNDHSIQNLECRY